MTIEQFSFNFSLIANQGLTFTSICITTLNELLHPPAVPASSAYHLIALSPSLLPSLTHINSWTIVQKYIQINSKTICDLCLPYRDGEDVYLGRYVVHRGRVLGVRVEIGKRRAGFKEWKMGRSERVVIHGIDGRSHNAVVGQFALRTANTRIALLFSSQLTATNLQRYFSHNYDLTILLTLDHPSQTHSTHSTMLQQLHRHTATFTNLCTESHNLIRHEHVYDLCQGALPERVKNVVRREYICLEDVFARKKYSKEPGLSNTNGQFSEASEISQISVPVYFNQPPPTGPLPSFTHELYHIQLPQTTSPTPTLPPLLTHPLSKLLSLFQFSQTRKAVVVLDQSAQSLCFLYFMDLLRQRGMQNEGWKKMIRVVVVENEGERQLRLLMERRDVIQIDDVLWVEINRKRSQQSVLLQAMDQIVLQQQDQQFFPVIANNPALGSVLHLLNHRPLHSDRHNGHKPLQSWLMTSLFTPAQTRLIYRSAQFRQFVNCQDLVEDTLKTVKKEDKDHDYCGLFEQMSRRMLEKMHKEKVLNSSYSKNKNKDRDRNGDKQEQAMHNPIIYYFHAWLRQLPSQVALTPLSALFFHFLVRQLPQNDCSLGSQLLGVDKDKMQELYELLGPTETEIRKEKREQQRRVEGFWRRMAEKGQQDRQNAQESNRNCEQQLSATLTIDQKSSSKPNTLHPQFTQGQETNLRRPLSS